MAKLYKHKQHGWQLNYNVYFSDGTHKAKFKHFKSKQKAVIALQDVDRLEILSANQKISNREVMFYVHMKYITADEATKITNEEICLTDPQDITWEVLETVYSKHIIRVGTKSTRESYPYKVKPLLEYFKDTPPYMLNKGKIDDYITHRRGTKSEKRGEPISKSTVNKEITALRVMLDHLVEKKVLRDNPARKEIKRFREKPSRPPRALDTEELKVIMEALDNYSGQACFGYFTEMIYSYLLAGMRRYELVELKKDNVKLRDKIIRVEGKGDKEREIEIHEDLIDIFKSVLKKNGKRTGTYFFGGYERPLMNPNSVYRAFKKFIIDLKLPNYISLHLLRHTWTSYMLEGGASIKKVKDQAGHANIKTTMGYTHTVKSKTRAIDKLDYKKYIEEMAAEDRG